MNRKLLLVGALALAGALALSSVVSAAVDDPVLEDGGGHLVVMLVDDSADFASVMPQAIERELVSRDFAAVEPLLDALEAKPLYDPVYFNVVLFDFAAAEVGSGNCSNSSDWVSLMALSGPDVERLPTCTTDRRHDPGWQLG